MIQKRKISGIVAIQYLLGQSSLLVKIDFQCVRFSCTDKILNMYHRFCACVFNTFFFFFFFYKNNVQAQAQVCILFYSY
jgi:hypothetical protein